MLKFSQWRRDDGQDLVEYAFVLPVLMLLLMGIIEFGVAVWHYDTVANVAREVARCGIIYSESWDDRINGQCIPEAIQTFGLGLNLTAGDFSVYPPELTGDNTIRVEVDYNYQPIIAAVTGGGLPFRTVVTMRNEY
jgi:Flp pilus assembly protein TadG